MKIRTTTRTARSIISPIARIAAWGLAVAIFVLSIVPPGLRPETGLPHALEHSSIFWATGLAFGLGYDRRHGSLAILLVLFSGAVEVAQLFVPGRHARLSDFIIDAASITVGVMMVSLADRIHFGV